MKVGDKIYFTREAEDLYREITRLSNPRGDVLPQGFMELINIGRKRYHFEIIWIKTEASGSDRYYKYQEDLIEAIEREQDSITQFFSYNSARTIPFKMVDELIESGKLKVLSDLKPWDSSFADQGIQQADLFGSSVYF